MGPSLFLLYLNDTGSCCQQVNFNLITNDSTVSGSASNLEHIILVILHINNHRFYFVTERLSLNFNKVISHLTQYLTGNRILDLAIKFSCSVTGRITNTIVLTLRKSNHIS